MKTLKDLREKSVSQAQQKMMGMALAYKRGEMDDASPEVKKMANSMSTKDLEDFAKTKHKGLPVKKEVEEASNVYQRYTASEVKKRQAEREKRNAGTTQAQRMRQKMYGNMMGGLKKEEVEIEEAAPKLRGNDGPYTRQQIEKAAKEAKVDMGAKARMMMALRDMK